MANQKISELTAISTIDNSADVLPIVDTSATTTKKVTPIQLKTSLSLNNVDNTSDANKPISTATQTALDAKQATLVSGTNIKTVNNTSLLGSGNITIAGGGGTWGSITGTLSSQTDLQTALDGKVDKNTAITGATKTKVTYDSKGLVTAGADATTADIADSTNKRYVTDAQLTVIGNTSGTNTGDNAVNSLYSGLATSKQDALGFTPENVANKSISVTTDQASSTKYPTVKSVYDWAVGAFQSVLVSGTNIKTVNSTSLLGSGDVAVQATLVSGTNIKTINSTSLLGSGDIVISASPSGVAGAIQFSNGSAFASDAANLFFDDTNNRLGVGTNAPSATGHFKGSGSTSATTSLLVQNSAGNNALQVTDDQMVRGYSGTSLRFRLGTTTVGQGVSTREGEFAVGFIDTNQSSCLRLFVASSTAFSYIDGYTEGALKAQNYAIVFGSRANNTGQVITGSTTQENGSPVVFGSAVIDASALVQINSTTRGFLPPRMTTTQKNAIATPASGLVVYDSTTNKLQCYNGSTWNDLF